MKPDPFADHLRALQADQGAAGLAELAGTLGGYYKELIAAGMPARVSAQLARDLQFMLMSRSLYPDAPPLRSLLP